jgi:hypothetical protein
MAVGMRGDGWMGTGAVRESSLIPMWLIATVSGSMGNWLSQKSKLMVIMTSDIYPPWTQVLKKRSLGVEWF